MAMQLWVSEVGADIYHVEHGKIEDGNTSACNAEPLKMSSEESMPGRAVTIRQSCASRVYDVSMDWNERKEVRTRETGEEVILIDKR